MSVSVMAKVFERYPNGGGELVLALALADHAHDDGTHIYPSVAALAKKTRQSERTVQYQLRRMEESGWLQLVAHAQGGRGMAREYRIDPDWIKGAKAAPIEKGATDDAKGCNPERERVQSATEKGAAAVAPQPSINHQPTVKEPPARARAPEDATEPAAQAGTAGEAPAKRGRSRRPVAITLPEWAPADLWQDWLEMRLKKRAPATEKAQELALRQLALLKAEGEDPARVLEQSILRGWTGLFSTRHRGGINGDPGDHYGRGGRRESTIERVERINREHDRRDGLL